ncbi:MAG TPA: rRNA maturation RNase YbeY [Phycisphaerales bacterium]|nr:rRNA maturation RNase YbeY [Phycisphaerales bacterium]
MTPKRPPPRVLISSTQRAVRVPRRQIAELVAFTAEQEGVRVAEMDIAIVASDEVATHNRRWLGHAGATDVLSFDLSDGRESGLVGQLILCGDVAAAQGPAHGQTARRELLLYVVHGLLHLMGHEDQSIRGAARMHAREDEILSAFFRRKPAAKKKS